MTQFIQALSIDWTKISPDSYLRSIPAIASLDYWFITESCGIDRNAIDKRSMKDF